MADALTLRLAGRRYTGWTEIEVERSIDSCTDAFDISLTDKEARSPLRLEIKTGEACEILIGEEIVLTGWIDEANPAFDATNHTLRVSGRDKTGDLIDCSAVHTPGRWKDRTLAQIAEELLKPFGLKLKVSAPVGAPFKVFALEQGETVFDAISRMCRYRGVLPVGLVDGGLEIIRPGQRRAGFSLEQGVAQIISAAANHSSVERFSQYLLKAQAAGDDNANRRTTNQAKGEANDPGVTRYRPLLLIGDEQGDAGSLKDRAAWEASVRAGKGSEIELTLPGWRDPAGALWAPDLVIPVKAPWLNIEADLLLSRVVIARGEKTGTTTTLTLAPPKAFTLEPPPAEAKVSEVRR